MKFFKIALTPVFLSIGAFLLQGCDDSKSYSELLNEEEHAVNWYLAKNKVSIEVPADGKFETGKDAPYYKMDKDGYVYMQVINAGNPNSKPAEGDRVYFRFMRMNVKSYQQTGQEMWDGNSDNLASEWGNTSLIYGNDVLGSTTQYGEGIQVPLEYLGYDSEVNLIIKSPQGWAADMSQCVPYLYNIRYFKAIY